MPLSRTHHVGIIMNGVTGRMGTNQHLARSICAIRDAGGIKAIDGDIIMPDPILVGRDADKLRDLCTKYKIDKSTTHLEEALDDPHYTIYFDAQTTGRRAQAIRKAIVAGKNIYCEKPCATSSEEAIALYRAAEHAGLKTGVVQDKLFLPGLLKLRKLIDRGFFGTILSVRGEFGYWVFDGKTVPSQRPSWNYRKEDDGGIISDMVCHWQYVIESLFGDIKSISCTGATHIKERIDESGKPYRCTADDAAYATFELHSGVMLQFNSSWVTRVRRDDLLTIHVDGSQGSAVAGLRDCVVQHESATPRPVWNPDVASDINFFDSWTDAPESEVFENAFRVQWEMFLQHVVKGAPWSHTLLHGAKGVQLAEIAVDSWEKRCWMDIPPLTDV